MKHDDVMEACTIGVPDDIYGEALVCYVVPRTNRSLTADIMKSHCSAVLPNFKQPSEIRIVDDIARNDRGNPDRNTMKNLWLSAHGEPA